MTRPHPRPLAAVVVFACALLALPVLADTGVVPAPDEVGANPALVPALVALGAALVRFAIVVVKPNAAKLGKWGVVILGVLAVAAGFLEHLAGGGSLVEAIAVAVSLLGGVFGGQVAAKPVVKARADRIKDGSINLGR